MPAGNTTPVSASPPEPNGADKIVLAAILMIAVLRSVALLLSPLDLGVDEAQYWLWSQTFDFGYYTKPPMTSWIIAITHGLFGHESWAVRFAAPWLHFATALLIWRTAGWLYGQAAGRWAGLLWMLLPAVSLGSFVMSTDTPLLFFWAGALCTVTGVICRRISPSRGMFFAGLLIGGGMLAKYAAIYFLLGILLYWLCQGRANKQQSSTKTLMNEQIFILKLRHLALALTGMLLAASPNLGWQLLNDFATVRHLGDNANLAKQSYSLINSVNFLGAQFATAGPLCFALMVLILRSAEDTMARRLLICLSVPVLAIITMQAFLSEANANWALTAMPALVVWLAGWIARRHPIEISAMDRVKKQRWGLLAIAINGGIALFFLGASMSGDLGPLTPKSDPMRHLRGWQALSLDVDQALATNGGRIVIADRRATAALLTWYFYRRNVTVLIHDGDGIPSNHFEENLAWQPKGGRQLLWLDGRATPPQVSGVTWDGSALLSDVAISARRHRKLYLHQGHETGE